MHEPKPTDEDSCPLGERSEIRKPRLNGNEGLSARVSRLFTDIGVEMSDPSFSVVFFLMIKEV